MYPNVDFYKDERVFSINAGTSETINLLPAKQIFIKSIQISADSDITINSFIVNDKDLTGELSVDFESEYGELITYKSIQIQATNNSTDTTENVKIVIKGIVRE